MNVYIYNADIYCEDCGEAIRQQLYQDPSACVPINRDDEESYDSDDFPKGPYPDGGGEADYPQHCGAGPECVNATRIGDIAMSKDVNAAARAVGAAITAARAAAANAVEAAAFAAAGAAAAARAATADATRAAAAEAVAGAAAAAAEAVDVVWVRLISLQHHWGQDHVK